jgi:hypothetical protein
MFRSSQTYASVTKSVEELVLPGETRTSCAAPSARSRPGGSAR